MVKFVFKMAKWINGQMQSVAKWKIGQVQKWWNFYFNGQVNKWPNEISGQVKNVAKCKNDEIFILMGSAEFDQ